MPYESRYGCTTKRPKDYRHDPSRGGIFIHGGTCCAGPFSHNAAPNRFRLTVSTDTRKGIELDMEKLRPLFWDVVKPTFLQALRSAQLLRAAIPELLDCSIYACTDLQMENTYSGRYEVQRVD